MKRNPLDPQPSQFLALRPQSLRAPTVEYASEQRTLTSLQHPPNAVGKRNRNFRRSPTWKRWGSSQPLHTKLILPLPLSKRHSSSINLLALSLISRALPVAQNKRVIDDGGAVTMTVVSSTLTASHTLALFNTSSCHTNTPNKQIVVCLPSLFPFILFSSLPLQKLSHSAVSLHWYSCDMSRCGTSEPEM